MPWLDPDELRVGLGCMRLPTDEAAATIEAAREAGVTVFDTARAYEGSEALLARTLRGRRARVVTKGGMARPGGAWVPDGRAKAIRTDCEASLAALDGVPIDLYLLHAPDPRTPWRTSVRALARLVDERLVGRVGVCNVNRAQLDEAFAYAPITAVQVGLSVLDDRALRSGILDRCVERGISLVAHSPLGGPRRKGALSRHEGLASVAAARDATSAEVALAWLLGLSPNVLAIPGARNPAAAASAARAARMQLDDEERSTISKRPVRAGRTRRRGNVVLVMGVPGAGKSLLAAEYADRGYERLNRDEQGGSLRELARLLDEKLATGAREVVLDNTYLTRETRSHVLEAASAHGLPVRCIWLDTPLAQAQVNLVERLLERFGRLPTPDELKEAARAEPGLLTPTRQMRAFRELEPPTEDEGFVGIERVAFERKRSSGRPGVFVASAAAERLRPGGVNRDAPHLVFDWRPGGSAHDLDAVAIRIPATLVETALCAHPGGPPTCWCRPPLPGLLLDFARRHGVDPSTSILVGASTAHRTLASTVGARYVGD